MRSAWHAAHPTWLPTLPPPSFTPNPTYLDPSLLRTAKTSPFSLEIQTPLAVALFDPRELAIEVERALPASSLGAPVHAPSPSPSRPSRWRTTIALGATAAVTASLVAAAIALASEDVPSASRSAAPPPAAMDLPAAKRGH